MRYQNGYLIEATRFLVSIIKYLNIVEILKYGANKLINDERNRLNYINFVIDSFICAKWFYLIIISDLKATCLIHKWIIYYLLFSNAFTYFYYHVWEVKEVKHDSKIRDQRRYLTLMLSILYSIYGFAVLYELFYFNYFLITPDTTFFDYFSYSLGNSFGGYTGTLIPENTKLVFPSTVQLFLTFILISTALAGTNIRKEKD